MSETTKDILLYAGFFITALGFVSWGSESVKEVFHAISKYFLHIKIKISELTKFFLMLSALINVSSGAYFSYAFLSHKDIVETGSIIAYVFVANCMAFIVGVVLYFINIPFLAMHSFITWTLDKNFELKWKILFILISFSLTVYTAANN